ncbi:MAG: hypothetical protein A4E63_00533 [Syntrophorhabdus sp. PtaU1.Bin050]|nr:MAG: hypothetical protein A4E63_00533 [Syntrophorhabdus sp. PtaU1.Bin050]
MIPICIHSYNLVAFVRVPTKWVSLDVLRPASGCPAPYVAPSSSPGYPLGATSECKLV